MRAARGDSSVADTALDLLLELCSRGLEIHASADSLSVRGRLSDESRAELKHWKRDLLELMLSGRQSTSSADIGPLSQQQRRLWFLSQLKRQSNQYNVAAAYRLSGHVDERRLVSAIEAVVAEHSALRAIYRNDGTGRPYQIALQHVDCVNVVDLRSWPSELRNHEAQRLQGDLQAAAFDLETEVPFRALIIRLSDDTCLLALSIHHVAVDGESMRILEQGISTAYDEPTLRSVNGPAARSYIEYARTQAEDELSAGFRESLSHWCEELTDAPSRSMLRPDYPEGDLDSSADTYVHPITDGLRSELSIVCRQLAISPATLFQGVYAFLLAKYVGRYDVTHLTPVANRDHQTFAGTVGLFANTIAIRTRIEPTDSVAGYLYRFHTSFSRSLKHARVPMDLVLRELAIDRVADQSPLAQSIFVYQGRALPALSLDGVDVEVLPTASVAAKFDLAFTVQDAPLEAVCSLNATFRSAKYARRSIELFCKRFESILALVASDPKVLLRDIDLLLPEERSTLLTVWNTTSLPQTEPPPFAIECFEGFCRTQPSAVAVRDGDEYLQYSELNERAERLAGRLTAAGIGPASRVGILLPRSAANIVAVLATLKVGAAYVPLDPAHPQARIQFICSDAEIAACITSDARRPDWLAPDCVHLDSSCADKSSPITVDRARYDARAPSFVIYTSGTSGKPKGVVLTQEGLANLISNMSRVLEPTQGSVVCQFATPGFDAATWEYFMALGTGAALYIPSEAARRDPARLMQECKAAGVTHLTLPPALLPHLSPETLGVSHLISVGEACSQHEATRWGTSKVRFFNGYGPSEATCATTLGEYDGGGLFTIGRPLRNVVVTVRDEHRNVLPEGMVGELHVGGCSVASGYINRREASRAAFYLEQRAHQRWVQQYATGDAVRWLSSGELEYVGRMVSGAASSDQVKIRGHRIELGEIEVVLRSLPGVLGAVVSAEPGAGSDLVLVAYVVQTEGEAEVDYRVAVSEVLPATMVPSQFVQLDAFPLTVNGKIDRKALRNARAAAQCPPGADGGVEGNLAEIWKSLLGVDRVAPHDNFFHQGGHSLLAFRFSARVTASVGKRVPVHLVYDHPVFDDLKRAIDRHLATESGASAGIDSPDIVAVDREGEHPLSPVQNQMWYFAQSRETAALYNTPTAWRFVGPLDADLMQQAFDRLVARHEALRTRFTRAGGNVTQRVVPEGCELQLSLPTFDASNGPDGQEKAFVEYCERDAARPFDLAEAPLARSALWSASANEHFLYFNLHHIICDGPSIRLMLRELMEVYHGLLNGLEIRQPVLRVQYIDYARWQSTRMTTERVAAQRQYWIDALSDAPAVLTIPRSASSTEAAKSDVPSRFGAALGEDITGAARRLAQEESCTPFAVYLTAWALYLARMAGQQEVVVGIPVSHRVNEELQGVVGLFVNTLPIRVSVKPDASFRDTLREVRRRLLGAYEHQDLSFDGIVEAVRPKRVAGKNPIFQAFFNYTIVDGESAVTDSGPYKLEEVGLNRPPHFDISLNLQVGAAGAQCSMVAACAQMSPRAVDYHGPIFVDYLERLIQGSSEQLRELPLLGAAAARKMLGVGTGPKAVFDDGPTIYDLFCRQVDSSPDVLAVSDAARSYSYASLRNQATVLAGALVRKGVSRGDRVALVLPSSADTVVALLACLQLGAAYVPTDLIWPDERINGLIEDCRPTAIISDLGSQSRVSTAHRSRIVDVAIASTQGNAGDLAVDAQGQRSHDSSAIAYVMYTSGSTGKPKGVRVDHRSLINYWRGLEGACCVGLSGRANVAQNASFSFDVSLSVILQLLSGRSMHVIPTEIRMDHVMFAEFIRSRSVNAFECTPPQLNQLVRNGVLDEGVCPSLTHVFVGGDAVDAKLWTSLVERGDIQCYNLYGPTECTVYATVGKIDSGAVPHIGRPMLNTSIYVLDEARRVLPVGVVGEIFIGGRGVAQGYFERDELTAERFVDDPFDSAQNARMYRTGDLARWTLDGNVEFLGRADFQVKVRGYRVELPEIEVALSGVPGVREAVVVAIDDGIGGRRLVAHVVQDASGEFSADKARAKLKSVLPHYMVPSHFLTTPSLPLTKNGKVDRTELMSRSAVAEPKQLASEPLSQLARVIRNIWCVMLDVSAVAADDNFFDLGGHSLLAVHMLERVRTELEVEFPLRDLFVHPTLSSFCERCEELIEGRRTSHLVTLRPGAEVLPLFLIHPGEGEIGYANGILPGLDPSVPVHAIAGVGLGEFEQPFSSIKEMAAHYATLIREVQPRGPYRIGGWSAGGIISLEIARQLTASGDEVQFLGLIDASFDYERWATSGYRDLDILDETKMLRLYAMSLGIDTRDFDDLNVDKRYETIQATGILPQGVTRSTLKRHLVFRSSLRRALVNYELRGDMPCRVDFFQATLSGATGDPWKTAYQESVRIHAVAATHRSIVEGSTGVEIGRAISAILLAND